MKLLSILTTLLLLVSLKSFSQTVIVKDTNVVRLEKQTAILAAQDLIRYDELKIRTDLLQEKIRAYESIVMEKDGIIHEQRGTIARTKQMFNNQSQISTELQLKLFRSQKEVRKQKVIKWVVIGLAAVSGVFALR